MHNIEYKLIYDDIDESLEEDIIDFWQTNSNKLKNQVIHDFNKIVFVILNDNYPPYDVIVHENKERKVDSNGDNVHGDILGLAYVDRHYLEYNRLYYFYNEFIPFEIPGKSLDQVKKELYENTRKYLLSTKEIENYSDTGNYLGIILQKKDELLISEFGFKYYETNAEDFQYQKPDAKLDGCWYDNFDGSVLLPNPSINVDVL
jgi:hypothetical protein